MLYEKEALRYHSEPRPGKIEVIPSKPCVTPYDLSLAYTPGVSVPCLKIQEDNDLSFEYPFNRLGGSANVLIFPNLSSGNIAYKLLERLGGAKVVGPLLIGISRPFNVLHRGADMENVANVIAVTVTQAQSHVS